MILRPHHLLCTLGYKGLGYNKEFVKNMDAITSILNKGNIYIDLVIGTDDICKYCPKKLKKDVCVENDSVNEYDKKVMEVFKLEEKTYTYKELLSIIKESSTAESISYICSDCSWKKDCLAKITLELE